MSTSFLPADLDLAGNQVFDFSDSIFIAFVKRPFLDSLTANQTRLRKDPKMFARGGLAHSQLPGDKNGADAVLDQVAIHLRRKVPRRVLEPVEDQQPARVCQSVQRKIKSHIDN